MIFILIDVWLLGGWFPTPEGTSTCGIGSNSYHKFRLVDMGVRVELQSVVGSNCIYPTDRHAQQNQTHRKHHFSLRGSTWSIPFLLYPQLDLQILLWQFLLLDTNSLGSASNRIIRRLLVLLLPKHPRRQTGDWVANVNKYYTIMNILYIAIIKVNHHLWFLI